jgi:hypothetical protein
MTCPHLEETSALFDGRDIDRTHSNSCEECRAFLADAAALRESLRAVIPSVERGTWAGGAAVTRIVPRPLRSLATLGMTVALCVVLFLFLRPDKAEDTGPFAGLDGGGRAVVTVKDAR